MSDQEILKREIQTRIVNGKKKNTRFSLRAMARMIDVHPAALSEFLNGKRKFSPRLLEKLAINLGVYDDMATPHLVKKRLLNKDEYDIVERWEYYTLLSLVETKGFKEDIEWISDRTGIKAGQIPKMIERLIEIGHLKRTSIGLKLVETEIVTSDDLLSLSLQKRHLKNLQSAEASILKDDLKDRDFTFMTLAVDTSKMKKIKKMIRKFQDELAEVCQKGPKDEVYEFCFQVFPRTTLKKQK